MVHCLLARRLARMVNVVFDNIYIVDHDETNFIDKFGRFPVRSGEHIFRLLSVALAVCGVARSIIRIT